MRCITQVLVIYYRNRLVLASLFLLNTKNLVDANENKDSMVSYV